MTSATMTMTMRAVTQDRYGDAKVLRVAEVARPTVGDHEVLVHVRAAGLDRGTQHLMTGTPYAVRLALGLRRPRQPISGRDVAGTVAQVGSAVTRFAVGDEVYGMASGSFVLWPPSPLFAAGFLVGFVVMLLREKRVFVRPELTCIECR